jgi:ABC-2 type transport system permease protein
LKPMDFQKARVAETLGHSIVEGCMSALLIGTVLVFANGIILPSLLTGVLFFISLLASLFIKFCIVYLSSLLCFWSSNGVGIAWMRSALTNFFSGALVPLTFFPGWLKELSQLMPFQGIVYIPASIYLGKMDSIQTIQYLVLQWIWVIVLWVLGKFMWKWSVRQVTINGG